MPRLSTIVCTRDRVPQLRRAVRSLIDQGMEAEAHEIIVVDNGTVPLAEDALDAPDRARVRMLRVEEPGISRARNAGLEVAGGEIVAFIDDDAEVTPSWAGRILDAFEGSKVDAIGGKVLGRWPGSRPAWLPEGPAERLYSILDLGDRSVEIHDRVGPIGASMAFRRGVVEKAGGFPVWLGPGSAGGRVGEETRLLEAIRKSGGTVRYVPDAVAVHHVDPRRLSRRWLVGRAFHQGRTSVQIDRSFEAKGRFALAASAVKGIAAAVLFGKKELIAGSAPFATRVVAEAVRIARLLGITFESALVAFGPRR